jgi:hypothetical protein
MPFLHAARLSGSSREESIKGSGILLKSFVKGFLFKMQRRLSNTKKR